MKEVRVMILNKLVKLKRVIKLIRAEPTRFWGMSWNILFSIF